MVVVKASDRKALSIPLNGAEYLELDAKSSAAGLSLPAYVRTCCGLSPWIARGREMGSRARPASRHPTAALERMTITAVLTRDEHAGLQAQARETGTTVPQHVRTLCGFERRNTSLHNTVEREREEDDAWERLKRLGLEPSEFFTAES